jgi:alpha-tubulin suppressor-like RCC1 family protein
MNLSTPKTEPQSSTLLRKAVFGCSLLLLIVSVPAAATASPEIIGWGDNTYGQTNVPVGLSNIIALSGGYSHSLALLDNGTVAAWGSYVYGGGYGGSGSLVAADVPIGLSNVVAVAAGANYSLALQTDGTVVAWGIGSATNVPSDLSDVVAVAAGSQHSLALRADGSVVAWGEGVYGQTAVPAGLSNVVAVAAGSQHSLALRADGTVAAWGEQLLGQTAVPGLSNVVAVACGQSYSSYDLALLADGTVAEWTAYDSAPTAVPGLSNVVAVAAGVAAGGYGGYGGYPGVGNLALRSDGTVVAWSYGQTNLVTGLSNVVAVAAGSSHGLALVGLPEGLVPPVIVGPRLLIGTVDRPFHHRITAKNGAEVYWASDLPPGLDVDISSGLITGSPTQAGTFMVTLYAINDAGLDEQEVKLVVNLPLPGIVSELVVAGVGSAFSYAVLAPNATWLDAASLPSGLVLDTNSWVISGKVPLDVEDYTVGLTASNRHGFATGSLTIRVSTVVPWEYDYVGSGSVPLIVPAGLSNVVAVAAGGNHGLALRADGTVAAWGIGSATNVPADLSNVVAVAAGGNHSLALRADGAVTAWGDNQYGQTNVPAGLSNVVAVAAGNYHSLALRTDGSVVAWGANASGQARVPVNLAGTTNIPAGLSNVVAIAAESLQSVALRADGTVVTWGASGLRSPTVPGQPPASTGLSNVMAVAAGSYQNLALRADGTVIAWSYGQTNVVAGLSNVVAVAAGSSHSLALKADGTVVAWGASFPGQTSVPAGLSNVVAVAAGFSHSLALVGLPAGVAPPAIVGPRFLIGTVDRPFYHRITARNGALLYWATGLPAGLEVDPSTGLITGSPTQAGTFIVTLYAFNASGMDTWTNMTLVVNLPLPGIVGGLVMAGIGSGFNHQFVLANEPVLLEATGLPDGLEVDLAGAVISGIPRVLGDYAVSLLVSNGYGTATGTLSIRVSPVVAWRSSGHGRSGAVLMTMPAGLSNLVAVAAGGDHDLALRADRSVAAWGSYSTLSGYVPVTGHEDLSNVVAVAAGNQHDLALQSDGTVVAWGNYDNYDGSNSVTMYVPMTVPAGLSNVVAVAAGSSHSLALRADGTVAAWGRCHEGQTNVPPGLSNVVEVAGGYWHSLALRADGTVAAWGDNSYGQVNVPADLSNVVAVAAGDYHSLALRADGTVVGWESAGVPPGLSNVVAVAAGSFYSLALRDDGTVAAWGWGTDVPAGLTNVAGIAARSLHSLALLQNVPLPEPPQLSAGLSNGIPRFLLHGQSLSRHFVQYASALGGTNAWHFLGNVLLASNTAVILDPNSGSAPQRFYRVKRVPQLGSP